MIDHDELEERLRSDALAFEGLMSIIPANKYYSEDRSDQWKRKKQTKAQKKAALRARLDPSNLRSAQDVMDETERQLKRKRELDCDDGSDSAPEAKEKPREGMQTKSAKKSKLDDTAATTRKRAPRKSDDEIRRRQEEKKKRSQEKRQKKKQKQQEKANAKKLRREASSVDSASPDDDETNNGQQGSNERVQPSSAPVAGAASDNESASRDGDIENIDVAGLVGDGDHADTSSSPSNPNSPVSSGSLYVSSSSSVIPPTSSENAKRPEDKDGKIRMPHVDQEALKARLEAKIATLRAARNADGIDGKPARNRQELMEARRRKVEEKRQRKKEMRQQAREDEHRKAAEAELARLRGSGSPETPQIFSPLEKGDNFSFGRITFDDGQQVDQTASDLVDVKQKKGKSDANTALQTAEKKRQRLAGLDPETRTDIESKDSWLNAKKRAHGEKVKDDLKLLKKTAEKKEKQKQKSERDWNERLQSVEKGKEIRQNKRDDNLRKRREVKGSKPGKKASRIGTSKKKARPGFEGSFRTKAN